MTGNKLGEAIRRARGGKSLRQFARETGVSHTHIDSIERGRDPRTGKRVNITVTTLAKISQATGIPLSALIEKEVADK